MQKLAFIILMIFAAIKLPAKEIQTETWFPLQVGNTWNYKYPEADSVYSILESIP